MKFSSVAEKGILKWSVQKIAFGTTLKNPLQDTPGRKAFPSLKKKIPLCLIPVQLPLPIPRNSQGTVSARPSPLLWASARLKAHSRDCSLGIFTSATIRVLIPNFSELVKKILSSISSTEGPEGSVKDPRALDGPGPDWNSRMCKGGLSI